MKHHLPLHALVVVHSLHPSERLPDLRRTFPEHEVLSAAVIRRELVGPGARPELAGIVFAELCRRVSLKLSLGERVVALVGPLRREQRLALVRGARAQGAAIIYVLDHPDRLAMADEELAEGDGCAQVLHVGDGALWPVQPLPEQPMDMLRREWRGVTVIADVHGMLAPLERALEWARSRQSFAWLLGDWLDGGPQTLEVSDTVYHAVMSGRGAALVGNHERKIARYLADETDGQGANRLRLSDANRVTTEALARLSPQARTQWIGRFRSLLGRTSLVTQLGGTTLVHGAVHPSAWTPAAQDHRAIEAYALYGERDPELPSTDYARSFGWVDAVPAGKLVMVGHSIRAPLPLTITGNLGGRAVFLDTGCGKGGRLSTADLRFGDDGGLHLESFMVH